jgi:Domain of unknown function (DUF4169)
MGDLINLRLRRKTKAREERAAIAAANRMIFGCSLAEREFVKAEKVKRARPRRPAP